MRKLTPMHNDFNKYFAKYLSSKQGFAFALYVTSQLVESIEIDSKGHISAVTLTTDNAIKLDAIEKES